MLRNLEEKERKIRERNKQRKKEIEAKETNETKRKGGDDVKKLERKVKKVQGKI